jgi:hypothetical protein
MPPMSRPEPIRDGFAHIVDADVVDECESSGVNSPELQRPVAAEETVEGMPVLAEVRAVQSHSTASLPAVQAVAVAATGFVAGAATLALVRRHGARKLVRSRGPRRALDALPIVGSRSFLVDVHLLAKPGE